MRTDNSVGRWSPQDETVASRPYQERWILANDTACARCRPVSDTVAMASDGRLETLALTDSRPARRSTAKPSTERSPPTNAARSGRTTSAGIAELTRT